MKRGNDAAGRLQILGKMWLKIQYDVFINTQKFLSYLLVAYNTWSIIPMLVVIFWRELAHPGRFRP
jgi:hypothetical protein